MKSKKYQIQATNFETELFDFLKTYPDDDKMHISIYTNGALVCFNDYSFMNSNQAMIVLRLDATDATNNIYDIEIIVGGMGQNMLYNINWGAGEQCTEKFEEQLLEFCNNNNAVFNLY